MISYPWNNPKKDASTLSADWADAILALAEREKGRKPDPRPLAKLLRKGGAPDEALEYIAELIDPIFKELDYRLVPKTTGFRKKESLKKMQVKHKSFLIAAAMRARLVAGETVGRPRRLSSATIRF